MVRSWRGFSRWRVVDVVEPASQQGESSSVGPVSGGKAANETRRSGTSAHGVPSVALSTGRAEPLVTHGRGARFGKRTFDILFALVGIVLAVPVFLVVALLIKLASSGPVFFTQRRIGRDGREFTMIKFRTMLPGTHDATISDPIERQRYVDRGYKLAADDDRITGIGRFLRKTSLDELPQLLNVLAGQMSIVGNRPLVRDEYAARPAVDRELYASLRPGLTGLWQVTGRSSLATTTRLELDRKYVESCSLWVDARILLKTPIALLRVRHAH